MRIATDNLRSPAALSRFLLTAAIGLGLDLWSKWFAFAKLAQAVTMEDGWVTVYAREPVTVIPKVLKFTVTANQGAVFGMGQGRLALFLAVSVGAILFLGWLFASSGRQRFYQVVLGMLLAGVLGNMYDRVVFGYVRDMIWALPGVPNPFRWPMPEIFPWIFNVADSLLCVGVALMILHSLVVKGEKATAGTKAPAKDSHG